MGARGRHWSGSEDKIIVVKQGNLRRAYLVYVSQKLCVCALAFFCGPCFHLSKNLQLLMALSI